MAISRSTKAIGIICAMIASVAFTLNDVGIKFLSGDYALHQIVFSRTVVALAITTLIMIPLEGGFALLKTKHLRMHILRGFFVVIANMSFFMGLAAIPLADATAIFFVSPLVITIFSVIFLGEKVGPWRWAAVASGLLGVFIVLRPGTDAFQFAALFPLVAACGYGALHIMTRKMAGSEKASTMAFYTHVMFLIVSVTIGLVAGDGRFSGFAHPSIEFLTRAWVMPSSRDLWVLVGIGVMSALGGYMITQAYRLCEAALVAPFEYLALVLAVFWGIVFFAEWPATAAWVGIILILSAGLFIFWRETVNNRPVSSAKPLHKQE